MMSGKKSDITHSGIVEDIDTENVHVRVRIVQTSACASCKAAGYCMSAESKEKIIDVYDVRRLDALRVGDEVMLSVSYAKAASALLWAFGWPFVILMCVIFTLVMLGCDEIQTAICSIAALIPYYILLYLLKKHFQQRITFNIEGH